MAAANRTTGQTCSKWPGSGTRAQAVFKGLGRGSGLDDVMATLNLSELRAILLKRNLATGREEANVGGMESLFQNIEAITSLSAGRYAFI